MSDKKTFITKTAAELFREKGFKGASIRDLATRVGLEPSSLYSHFKSKEEILTEICMPIAEYFAKGIEEISISDSSPKNKLREIIKLHIDIAYNQPAFIEVFYNEWKFLAHDKLMSVLESRKKYEKIFKKILIIGKKKGKFDIENIDIVFSLIIKSLNISDLSSIHKYKKSKTEENLSTFLLKAIGT